MTTDQDARLRARIVELDRKGAMIGRNRNADDRELAAALRTLRASTRTGGKRPTPTPSRRTTADRYIGGGCLDPRRPNP